MFDWNDLKYLLAVARHRSTLAASRALGVNQSTVQRRLMELERRIGRTLVNASLQYMGIGWSFLFGVLWFDDAVTALALVGMALSVAAGIAAASLRRSVNPADPANSTVES